MPNAPLARRGDQDRGTPPPAAHRTTCQRGIGSKELDLAERSQNNERFQWRPPSALAKVVLVARAGDG